MGRLSGSSGGRAARRQYRRSRPLRRRRPHARDLLEERSFRENRPGASNGSARNGEDDRAPQRAGRADDAEPRRAGAASGRRPRPRGVRAAARARARSTARSPTSRSRTSTTRRMSPDLDLARDLAWPGEYPYTRGIHPNGYRDRLWTMRQFAGFGIGQSRPTSAITFCSRRASTVSPSPSICRRSWATTPTPRNRAAKSASAASRSTRWPTWKCSSTASTWARSPPR